MSDSDSDVPARRSSNPSKEKVEATLREVVVDYQTKGKSDQLTVNVVREAAESKLGLQPGFLKARTWKERSKEIIHDQASKEPEPNGKSEVSKSKKRKSPATERAPKQRAPKSKKRRTSVDSEDSEQIESSHSSSAEENEKKTAPSGKPEAPSSTAQKEESPLSDIGSEDNGEGEGESKKPVPEKAKDESDSDLSSLIDEDPPPKKRGKEKTTGKKAAKPPSAKKASEAPDADQEEIKKLQGWLVKCGIRKLWGKELAPYEGSKAKIRHLKQMLTDAGMTGRYSMDKARQIKESRELAADLEAVQEGNKMWGMEAEAEAKADEDDEKSESEAKPRRRLARGLQELAFISDEESD